MASEAPVLTFYSKRGAKGERRWRWRLVAANGEPLARSSQGKGFTRFSACVRNQYLTAYAFGSDGIEADIVGIKVGETRTFWRSEIAQGAALWSQAEYEEERETIGATDEEMAQDEGFEIALIVRKTK